MQGSPPQVQVSPWPQALGPHLALRSTCISQACRRQAFTALRLDFGGVACRVGCRHALPAEPLLCQT